MSIMYLLPSIQKHLGQMADIYFIPLIQRGWDRANITLEETIALSK